MFRSEKQFVDWLRSVASARSAKVKLGIGDDAALVSAGGSKDLILTTDLSIEGVHFTRALHPAPAVGHRAFARSLSDIAAMGGTPRFALVSLGLSRQATRAWVEGFYRGLFALARRHGVEVVGGDTALVPGSILIDIILTGEVSRGKAILRSGARPGDQIFVSGRLGLSGLGLQLLKSRAKRSGNLQLAALAVNAHSYPEPQCDLGRLLSKQGLATAAIDISDGLSSDLDRLCEASGVGARIWENLIPGPWEPAQGRSPSREMLRLALHGGEDYQLLFTVPSAKASRVPRRYRGVQLRGIGEVTRLRKLRLIRATGKEETLISAGWDHFQKSKF